MDQGERIHKAAAWLVLVLLGAAGLLWQLGSTSDIDDNEQPITLSHFMDVAVHGHWLSQFNPFEGVSTKPPLYHWLGGVAVMVFGHESQWVFRLPSVLSFVVTCVLVVLLARTCLSPSLAWLAGAVWVANFHVLKLAGTVRPDMTLALFMTLGLLALQYLRQTMETLEAKHGADAGMAVAGEAVPPLSIDMNENVPDGEAGSEAQTGGTATPVASNSDSYCSVRQTGAARYWLWTAVLWTSVMLAGMTKGPPALLVVLMVYVMFAWEGRFFSRRMVHQTMGMAVAVGVVLGWLWLAMSFAPDWGDVVDREVWQRLSGEGVVEKDYPPRWREVHYFMGRFAPWSVLATAGLVMVPWWQKGNGKLGWAAVWVLLVLVVLAIPKGRRADHILPVYAGASVLVAAVVQRASQRKPRPQCVVHLLLGGVCIGGLVAAVGGWWLPRPAEMVWRVATVTPAAVADDSVLLLSVATVLGVCGGGWGLWELHRRRYLHATLAACVAMVAMAGVYEVSLERASVNRQGDQMVALAQTAARVMAEEGRQPLYYDTGYVPVQSLLGDQQQMRFYRRGQEDVSRLLLVTSERGWQRLASHGATGEVLLQTGELAESRVSLMLVRPRSLPAYVAQEQRSVGSSHAPGAMGTDSSVVKP